MLGVVSQTRVSGGNPTHDPHANSLALYPLDYQGTLLLKKNIFRIYVNHYFVGTYLI